MGEETSNMDPSPSKEISGNLSDDNEIKEMFKLLWGPGSQFDSINAVFQRWSQGFVFSEYEPSALVQMQGGPCTVIASVQAYLLKILIMETPGHSLSDLTPEKCKKVLIQAIANILMKCKDKTYRIVTLNKTRLKAEEEARDVNVEAVANQESSSAELPSTASNNAVPPVSVLEEDDRMKISMENLESIELMEIASNNLEVDDELTPEQFHERLCVHNIETIDNVEKFYSEHFDVLQEKYGVLLLLYTVLLTKGIENVTNELGDTSEPIIHNVYGYGSQALINLMLTGMAVQHVWDNDQDLGGLKLRGISQQSDIGFITLMETLEYCTVGSFYKNPKNPVWIMGSDIHLTVLFSSEKRLVSPESKSEMAHRIFRKYDTEGSKFIQTGLLQDILCELELESDPAYVSIMQRKLDAESLGIILLNDFMEEFFPDDRKTVLDTFPLMHYNGIPNSNVENRVKYCCGTAILLETDMYGKSMTSLSNSMLTCLQTKWPTIEINWNIGTPSLN